MYNSARMDSCALVVSHAQHTMIYLLIVYAVALAGSYLNSYGSDN